MRTRNARFTLPLSGPTGRPMRVVVSPRGLIFREKHSRSTVELSFEDAYAVGTKIEKSGQLVAFPQTERRKA